MSIRREEFEKAYAEAQDMRVEAYRFRDQSGDVSLSCSVLDGGAENTPKSTETRADQGAKGGATMTNKKHMSAAMMAEFDTAFREKFGCGIDDVDGRNEDTMAIMGAAMWAWQASREAVMVEIPTFSEAACKGTSHLLRDFRNAIVGQGLKVAP